MLNSAKKPSSTVIEPPLLEALFTFFQTPNRMLFLLSSDLTILAVKGCTLPESNIGQPITERFPALIGYEPDLFALKGSTKEFQLGPIAEITSEHLEQAIYLKFHVKSIGENLALFIEDTSETTEIMRAMVQKHNELCLAQKELERARDRAQESTRMMNSFVANMSHELRTPLSVILGNAEILKTPQRTPFSHEELRDYAEDIEKSGTFLLDLVNDIIDVSKIKNDKFNIEENWCDGTEILNAALEIVTKLPESKNVHFVCKIQPDLPKIWVDYLRIRQILINLISNAIKFTPPHGTISFAIFTRLDNSYVLRVKDQGPGLSPEEIELVLQPFGQTTAGQEKNGSGLGLSIAHSLTQAHDGVLHLESCKSNGLCVEIQLPASRCRGVS